jgi:PST family polysaccharide transporter
MVVLVLSGGFIVSGFRTVPYSLLQKELRFKLLAVIEGLQGVVQALVTLVLALLGFGYWALVLGVLSFSITPTGLVLIWRRQSFALPKFSSLRKAIVYSRHILIGRLCWAAYNDSDFIVAGRVLGEAPLGAYTLAWTLAHTPLEKLTTLINRVTPSVFATIQTDSEALRRYIRNITGVMALVIFPATIGLALVAPEFVPLVLGPKWNGVVIPLELLALHALVRSNVILLTPLLNVIGEERLVMWNSVVAMIVLPISFYIGSRWGTAGIAAGWVVIYPLLQLPLFLRIFRRIDLPGSEYWRTLWPALSGCIVMALSIQALKSVSGEMWPLYARLASEILVGIIAYGSVLLLLHRNYLRGILQFVRASRSGAI